MMEVAGGGEVREREGEKKVGRKKRRRRGRGDYVVFVEES